MMVTVFQYSDIFGFDLDKVIFNDDSIDYDGDLNIWIETSKGNYFDMVKPIYSETILTAINNTMKLNYYQMPFKINRVNGSFNIHYNNGLRLLNSPREINCFIDMSYMPKYVNGNFESRVFFKNFNEHPIIISKQFKSSFIEWDCAITNKNRFKEKFKNSFLVGKGASIYDYKNNNSYVFYVYNYINRKKFFSDFNKDV